MSAYKTPSTILTISILLFLIHPSISVSGDYASQGQNWTGTCAVNGSTQSPFSPSAATNDPKLQEIYLEFDNWQGTLQYTANNYILKMDIPAGKNGRAVMLYNGIKCSYTALRIQFHAPGEHSVNFRYRDLEAQIIMQKDESSCNGPGYIGLSFLFDSDIPSLNSFLNNLGITDQAAAAGNPLVTGTAEIPTLITEVESTGFYTYQGSLTSGSCDEVCVWLIAITEYKMTANQQAFFDNLWKNNGAFSKVAGEGNNRVLMNKVHSAWYDHNRRSYSIPDSRMLVESKSTAQTSVPSKLSSTSSILSDSAVSIAFSFMLLAFVALIMGLQ